MILSRRFFNNRLAVGRCFSATTPRKKKKIPSSMSGKRKMGENCVLDYDLPNIPPREPPVTRVMLTVPIVHHGPPRTTLRSQCVDIEQPSVPHRQKRQDSLRVASSSTPRIEIISADNQQHPGDVRTEEPRTHHKRIKVHQPAPTVANRKAPTPDQYLDRISIAGLHEYLYANTPLERRLWLLVIIMSIAGTIYYLVPPFQDYLSFTTVWDIQRQTQPNMKLPNPYVCVWGVNFSYFEHKFQGVRPVASEDKRLNFLADRIGRRLAKLHPAHWANRTYDSDTFLRNTLEYMAAGIEGDTQWIDDIRHEYLDEAITKSVDLMGSMYEGVRAYYDSTMFDCPTVLRNCTLNGQPIDCCRDSISGSLASSYKCFKLDVIGDIRREIFELNRTTSDQRHMLSFETLIDRSFAPSSVNLFRGPMEVTLGLQNHMFSGFDTADVTVAVGTSSLVTVNGRWKRQMFGCIEKYQYNPKLHTEAHPLVQEYFKNMTQLGRYSTEECAEAKLLEKLSIGCGCVPYYKSIRPNDSLICATSQLYACMHAAMNPDGVDDTDPNGVSSKLDVWHDLKLSVDKECIPLCDTWSYDATVSSLDAEGDAGNFSRFYRSKITIAFDPEYVAEVEMLKMDIHAFLATVGDGLGLFFGMTFVTFAEIAFHVTEAVRLRRKNNKLTALVSKT